MFALTRYASVRRALEDWESFPSSYGVMMNDRMNQVLRGNTLCSDGADHDALRDVLVRPLTPRALRPVRDEIRAEAEAVVEKLVGKGTFDAVTDLANHLPVTVVSNLVAAREGPRANAHLGRRDVQLLRANQRQKQRIVFCTGRDDALRHQ